MTILSPLDVFPTTRFEVYFKIKEGADRNFALAKGVILVKFT